MLDTNPRLMRASSMPTPLGVAAPYHKSPKNGTSPSEFRALRHVSLTGLVHRFVGSLPCSLCSGGERRPLTRAASCWFRRMALAARGKLIPEARRHAWPAREVLLPPGPRAAGDRRVLGQGRAAQPGPADDHRGAAAPRS